MQGPVFPAAGGLKSKEKQQQHCSSSSLFIRGGHIWPHCDFLNVGQEASLTLHNSVAHV